MIFKPRPTYELTYHKPNVARLIRVRNFLAQVPFEQLSLSNWVVADGMLNVVPNKKQQIGNVIVEAECGTIACAVGWACAAPENIAEGLFMNYKTGDYAGAPAYVVDKQMWLGWEAIEQFFDLDPMQARLLFYSRRYHGFLMTTESDARYVDLETHELWHDPLRRGIAHTDKNFMPAVVFLQDTFSIPALHQGVISDHELVMKRLDRFISLFEEPKRGLIISSED
jgi:hypothetical protein